MIFQTKMFLRFVAMPPKKKEEAPKPPKILGRMGTNLKIGIVGLPNVGKSTFFNVLTKSAIPAENFPFCTIDPNEARVAIPDYRFDMLIKDWKPKSQVGFKIFPRLNLGKWKF